MITIAYALQWLAFALGLTGIALCAVLVRRELFNPKSKIQNSHIP